MKTFKNIKYIGFLAIAISITSCNDEEDFQELLVTQPEAPITYPAITAGSADFSTFVSVGNSLTSGLTDGALFKIAQENSMPNIMASKFALVGGGVFTQPLTNDNTGGLLVGGSQLLNPVTGEDLVPPRLVFDGEGPVRINTITGATATTDIVLNNPTGPFNNMGVPKAKSFHLLAPGYGNLSNLQLGLANPFFVRMASSPNASVLEDVMAQSPSFFSLWIGNNDVLGYALSGGDGTDPITPLDGPPGVGFEATYAAIVATLTSGAAQGVLANIPDVSTIPHFTTVPYNPLDPNDEETGPALVAQIPTLNSLFGALNNVYEFLQVEGRDIEFSETETNPLVIKDETLTDLSAQITAVLNGSPDFEVFVTQFGLPAAAAPQVAGLLGLIYGQSRQATPEDLFVLTSSGIIGQTNEAFSGFLQSLNLPAALAEQFSAEGVTLPLEDKWVLLPSEQAEIASATAEFNQVIEAQATAANLAFLDANYILNLVNTGSLQSGNYILNSALVTGGAFSLDGVHPTSRGYALLANEFLKAIDVKYGSNFEASGNLVDIGTYNTNYSPTLQ